MRTTLLKPIGEKERNGNEIVDALSWKRDGIGRGAASEKMIMFLLLLVLFIPAAAVWIRRRKLQGGAGKSLQEREGDNLLEKGRERRE